MAVILNIKAYNQAKKLIAEGKIVRDARDAWGKHQPVMKKNNEFIHSHGFTAYGNWHLGVDEKKSKNTKGRYKFPYGDFEKIHRCAILAIESRAGQYKYNDIEYAAAHLHGMIDIANDKTT